MYKKLVKSFAFNTFVQNLYKTNLEKDISILFKQFIYLIMSERYAANVVF